MESASAPPTIQEILARQAHAAPHRTALVCGDEVLTYGELNARANQLAHHLRECGVEPETLVPVCLERSLDLVVAIYGILRAGGAYVPLDPAHPADRLRFILDDCRASLLVSSSRHAAAVADFGGHLVPLDQLRDALAGYPTTEPPGSSGHARLAYAIYTSGSTGQPKGVLIEQRSVVNCLAALDSLSPLGPDDACLFKFNPAFDASLVEVFGPIVQGGRLVILPAGGERDPKKILAAIRRHAVTHLVFVPSMLQAFLADCSRQEIAGLGQLKSVEVGGEALGRALAERMRACFPHARLLNLYGPTEAAIAVTAYDLRRKFPASAAPIGLPFPNVTARVLDESLRPLPSGEEGELYIGGVAVARGYLNRPDLTATHFLADPQTPGGRLYRTGDLCRYLPGGGLEYLGRRDRQVKLRGYRIELGEIENRLAAHPEIADAAVAVKPDVAGEERLAAYFVLRRREATLDPGTLRRYLRQSLPEYMVPTAWRQMPSLPVTANGKRDLGALPEIEVPTASGPRSSDLRSPLGRRIAQTWAAELGIEAVGENDDFFALGGHSLSAARIASALRATLHKEVAVSDLYRAPTVGSLERLLPDLPDLPQQDATPTGGTSHPLAYQQLDLWLLAKAHAPNLNVLSRKRVAGHLDRAALSAAFRRVVSMHPALRYRISPWQPTQSVGEAPPLAVDERDLSALPPDRREEAALASIAALSRHTAWPPGAPLVLLRLLRLEPSISELQVCMPHIISDEASLKVFFDELSWHYQNPRAPEVPEEATYISFVREQRAALRPSLPQDRAFWEAYLDDAAVILFPESEVLAPDQDNESVYLEWPAPEVEALAALARVHQVSVPDLLHALALRAIAPYVHASPRGGKRAVFYTPRSTRTRAAYDRTIGPLARLDCLKADVADVSDLLALARRLRQAKIETEPHQPCPAAVKSAGLHKHRWEKMPVADRIARLASRVLTRLLPRAQLDYEVVLAEARMLNLQRAPVLDFALMVNVLNSFLAPEDEKSLFGFELAEVQRLPTYQPPVQRLLEIYFLREPTGRNHSPYLLMFNGDLSVALRQQLGEAIRAAAKQLC